MHQFNAINHVQIIDNLFQSSGSVVIIGTGIFYTSGNRLNIERNRIGEIDVFRMQRDKRNMQRTEAVTFITGADRKRVKPVKCSSSVCSERRMLLCETCTNATVRRWVASATGNDSKFAVGKIPPLIAPSLTKYCAT